jgi:hypothetical protein
MPRPKNDLLNDIFLEYKVSTEEYNVLFKEFGKLCYYAAHQLKNKNSKNNCVEDVEDINQDLQFCLIHAGSYHKRQIYIERCFVTCEKYLKDNFLILVLKELRHLWDNRKRHGANRQKFGHHQEKMLKTLIKLAPKEKQPNPFAPLIIDAKFATYCKSIIWNRQKTLGKKITKEKSIRNGQVSISEYDYLAANF